MDAEPARLVQADAEIRRRRDILASVPGIASVSATRLVIGMPELGGVGSKHACALIGAAPMDRQSGTKAGRPEPRGGSSYLAARLHMAALAACRANPDMRSFRDHLKAKGKPAKLIFTAVLRKTIVLADALIREDRKWTLQKS